MWIKGWEGSKWMERKKNVRMACVKHLNFDGLTQAFTELEMLIPFELSKFVNNQTRFFAVALTH